ncbi:dTDP-4-dehydrorhamnose reductase [Pricia antarctica]|uniref:dTDP-4-dehydrorhamnose reductase n=1 Tax=Pricia antarctica TaxID=641691 RepID=A0A1G6X4A5_9FLAO|nr:dTDP-4-dehydrorhamnose reductase [Pricia antarctica]SDD72145.1 dTDP-4-dehydrorhamnose reductase [Pricia antarctica]
MTKILVTGGHGQLASCIREVAADTEAYQFVYVDYDELDITKEIEVERFLATGFFQFCVNCAAYTAVDKAESEPEMAKKINVDGVLNLAKACKSHQIKLIQISTDFVFDGFQSIPYDENITTNPLGVYGKTKLCGEKAITDLLEEYFILRTSWLYSGYGHNFLKTMLNLAGERESLSVVCDQIGTPTYGIDLANVILGIIRNNTDKYGCYHYSNEGVASWYDFTKAIVELSGLECKVLPIMSYDYPTPAKRPFFSVFDKTKIKTNLGIEIPYWRDSLKTCLQNNS